MNLEEKMDDVRLTLHEMKPMLSSLVKVTDGLEVRTRGLEIVQGEHGVKIERSQQDLDGLGRKVRARIEPHPARSHTGGAGKLLMLLEFLITAPKWIHAVITVGSLATVALTILWRHWPRGN